MNQMESKLLYKYYPPEAYVLKALEDETICFTDLYSQNDPFESFGFYQQSDDNETLQRDEKELQTNVDNWITDDQREMLHNWCRIFCTTTQFDNVLMGSHYAKAHQGICVSYSLQDIEKYCHTFGKVKYSDHPITTNDDDPIQFLFIKAADWKYENEFRGVYHIQTPECWFSPTLAMYCSREADFDNEYLYLCIPHYSVRARRRVLKKCAVQEVTLGINTSPEFENKVKPICFSKEIPLYKAHMEKHSFNISRVLLNPPKKQ